MASIIAYFALIVLVYLLLLSQNSDKEIYTMYLDSQVIDDRTSLILLLKEKPQKDSYYIIPGMTNEKQKLVTALFAKDIYTKNEHGTWFYSSNELSEFMEKYISYPNKIIKYKSPESISSNMDANNDS